MYSIRTAARAIIRRGDELLVIRYRDEQGEWFGLPGGGQQHGEGMPLTLVREVGEETGSSGRNRGPLACRIDIGAAAR